MIETRDLTKTFDNFTAVDSLNLKIEKGEFLVFSDQTEQARQRPSACSQPFFFQQREKSS